jgi:hypothetical protein
MNMFKRKLFYALAAAAMLLGCPTEAPEEKPEDKGQDTNSSTTLLINNLSDFNLLAVEYSGVDFGDITSGKDVKREVGGGTKYIFFALQTNNGRVRCKTQPLTIEEKEQAVFTILNSTVVMTAVTERQDSLRNLKNALDTEPPNPKLEVTRNTYLVPSNSTVDLGRIPKGTAVTAAFTLTNKNEHDLQISGDSPQKSGSNAAQVSVTNYSANRLEYDATASFSLTFSPTTGGENIFSIKILSNDPANDGEYVINFSATVLNTWEKLHGAEGKRYGIYKAASNLGGGIYAGGYISDTTAAIFNIDQYGTIQNQFSFASTSGTLGPDGIGSRYGDFYSVLKGTGDGYSILRAGGPDSTPSSIATNLTYNNEPLEMFPAGIIKDDYYYIAGNAWYDSASSSATVSEKFGIFVNRHYSGGEWEKGTSLAVPTTAGITAESFGCMGIAKLTNGDILLYGYAEKSGKDVAFLCAVNISNTNSGSWVVRWTKTCEIGSQNTTFLNHFIDGTNIIIFGGADTSSMAVKFPLTVSAAPTVTPVTFGTAGTNLRAGLPMSDGSGYVFAGGNDSGPNGGGDVWVVKTNTAMSSIVWQFNYGGSGNDYADAIVEASDGFIVAGSTTSPSIAGQTRKGTEDIYILKINKDGTLDL